MFQDHKWNPSVTSQLVSTSERQLSVALANPRQIYTTGSRVAGIVNLSSKEPEKVKEVQVALVCAVRSLYHRSLGEGDDIRHETTKLIHRDQTLWTCGSGGLVIIPASLPFDFIIPEVGNDTRAKNPDTPLPPTFDAGNRRGWKNVMTYGTQSSYIKYYIKVSVTKKGILNTKHRAFCPFFFLPPSSPPPLLPPLPESIPDGDFFLPPENWRWEHTQTSIRHGLTFTPTGRAHLTLWLPRATPITRRTRVPFFLCLTLETPGTPPAVQPDRATLFLRQTLRSCARGGRQTHSKTYDSAPTDNLLHGLVPQVSLTRIIWRGLWTACDTPSFANRQLAWEYSLVAEVPIKGIGNGVELETSNLEIGSGVTSGTNIAPGSEGVLDVPPEYFEQDPSMGDDEDDGTSNEKV